MTVALPSLIIYVMLSFVMWVCCMYLVWVWICYVFLFVMFFWCFFYEIQIFAEYVQFTIATLFRKIFQIIFYKGVIYHFMEFFNYFNFFENSFKSFFLILLDSFWGLGKILYVFFIKLTNLNVHILVIWYCMLQKLFLSSRVAEKS